MTSGPAVFTASYRWLRRAIDAEPDRLWVPVRTSLGTPKFALGYELAEYCELLAPHTAFALKADYPRFEAAYVAQLEEVGAAAIAARFASYMLRHGTQAQIVLLCFEDLQPTGWSRAPAWCHRRIFADWYARETGLVIADLDAAAGPPEPPSTPVQPSLF